MSTNSLFSALCALCTAFNNSSSNNNNTAPSPSGVMAALSQLASPLVTAKVISSPAPPSVLALIPRDTVFSHQAAPTWFAKVAPAVQPAAGITRSPCALAVGLGLAASAAKSDINFDASSELLSVSSSETAVALDELFEQVEPKVQETEDEFLVASETLEKPLTEPIEVKVQETEDEVLVAPESLDELLTEPIEVKDEEEADCFTPHPDNTAVFVDEETPIEEFPLFDMNSDACGEVTALHLVHTSVLLKKVAVLGKGTFGQVIQIEYIDADDKWSTGALKVMSSKKAWSDEVEALDAIKDIPETLKVHWYGEGEMGDFYFICLDFFAGGALDDALFKYGSMPIGRCLLAICDLAESLEAVHQRGILHCDIKPPNILLESVEGDSAMVFGDWGLATRVSDFDGMADGICGTPGYMAPEVILGNDYDGRADIFALGATAYEMVEGTMLFEPSPGDTNIDIHNLVLAGIQPNKTFLSPAWYRPGAAKLRTLIEWCCNHDMVSRPTANQVLHKAAQLLRQYGVEAWPDLTKKPALPRSSSPYEGPFPVSPLAPPADTVISVARTIRASPIPPTAFQVPARRAPSTAVYVGRRVETHLHPPPAAHFFRPSEG